MGDPTENRAIKRIRQDVDADVRVVQEDVDMSTETDEQTVEARIEALSAQQMEADELDFQCMELQALARLQASTEKLKTLRAAIQGADKVSKEREAAGEHDVSTWVQRLRGQDVMTRAFGAAHMRPLQLPTRRVRTAYEVLCLPCPPEQPQ